MRLSAKIEYALKAMIELGLSGSGAQFISLSKIAREHDISVKFLLQLMLKIKSAGLVKSERGMGGGYMLTKSPKDIKLIDIITAVDGEFFSMPERNSTENTIKDLVISNIWKDYNSKVKSYFSEISLASLMDDFNKRGKFSYSI